MVASVWICNGRVCVSVQAPEVIMRRGTTKAADYWALGVLIFEMLVGDPPFKSLSGDPWDTFRRTLSGRFYVPNFISESASSLICQLLQVILCLKRGKENTLWVCFEEKFRDTLRCTVILCLPLSDPLSSQRCICPAVHV